MSLGLTRGSIVDRYDTFRVFGSDQDMELDVVSMLASNVDTSTMSNNDQYTEPSGTSNSYVFNETDELLINNTAMYANPTGDVLEKSVITSHVDTTPENYPAQNKTFQINSTTQTFGITAASVPYYDATVDFVFSISNDMNFDDSGEIQAVFDLQSVFDTTNEPVYTRKHGYEVAINSELNTLQTVNDLSVMGVRPLSMTEDVSFNTSIAFGKTNNVWGKVSTSTGAITLTAYPPENSIEGNELQSITIPEADLATVDDFNTSPVLQNSEVGLYRIQKGDAVILQIPNPNRDVDFTEDFSDSYNALGYAYDANNDHLLCMPIMDLGVKVLDPSTTHAELVQPLVNMKYIDSFRLMMNNNISRYNVYDNWTFYIRMNKDGTNAGGYYMQDVQVPTGWNLGGWTPPPAPAGFSNVPMIEVEVGNMDDLPDLPYYMQNYANNQHQFDFESGSVTLDVNIASETIPTLAGGSFYKMDSVELNALEVDLTAGEILPHSLVIGEGVAGPGLTYDEYQANLVDAKTLCAGVNGYILMNNRHPMTRHNMLSETNMGAKRLEMYVMHPNETLQQCFQYGSISQEMQESQSYMLGWQKIAHSSNNVVSALNGGSINLMGSTSLKQNGWASLSLWDGSALKNNYYGASDFTFSFTTANARIDTETHSMQLWRINAQNNCITESESFFSDADCTILEKGLSVNGVISSLSESLQFQKYRLHLQARTKETLVLYTEATAKNWVLTYSDQDTYLHSSSDAAFATSNHLPSYNADHLSAIWELAGQDPSITATYEYKTTMSATRPGGLNDYVQVSYTPVNSVTPVVFNIEQDELNRQYADTPSLSSSITPVEVNSSVYTLKSGYTNMKLYQVTRVCYFSATFPAHFGPFINLILTTPVIKQTDVYYALGTQTGSGIQYAPQSALASALDSVITVSMDPENPNALPDNYLLVSETVENALYGADGLSFEFTFTKKDLMPLSYTLEAYDHVASDYITIDVNGVATNMLDVYYGFTNQVSISLSGATLKTIIEYTPFSYATNETVDVLLDSFDYYIPFEFDMRKSEYSFQECRMKLNEIASKTSIGSASGSNVNAGFISVENGYSAVTSWSTIDPARVDISRDPNTQITTFKVYKTSSQTNQIFSISIAANVIFFGDIFVNYTTSDIYRVNKWSGALGAEVFSEEFLAQDLNLTVGLNQVVFNTLQNTMGVSSRNYSGVVARFVDTSGITTQAKYQQAYPLGYGAKIEILASLAIVCLLDKLCFSTDAEGVTSLYSTQTLSSGPGLGYTYPSANNSMFALGNPSYNNAGLDFQAVVTGNGQHTLFSAIVRLPKFRGYAITGTPATGAFFTGTLAVMDIMSRINVVRTPSVGVLRIAGGGSIPALSSTLSSNLYYQEPMTMRGLSSSGGSENFDLNTTIVGFYSIAPVHQSFGSPPVITHLYEVRGDDVEVGLRLYNTRDFNGGQADEVFTPNTGDGESSGATPFTLSFTTTTMGLVDYFNDYDPENPPVINYPTWQQTGLTTLTQKLFEFTGNYLSPGGNGATRFAPSRLRVSNAYYREINGLDESFVYAINYQDAEVQVLKAKMQLSALTGDQQPIWIDNVYLNNPMNMSDIVLTNMSTTASSTELVASEKWVLIRTVKTEKLRSGFRIGSQLIKLANGVTSLSRRFISFFSCFPPELKFTQVSSNQNIGSSWPYQLSDSQLTTAYVPCVSQADYIMPFVFNPYRSYNLSVWPLSTTSTMGAYYLQNPAYMNNITFTYTPSDMTFEDLLTQLVYRPNSARRGISVKGLNVDVYMDIGVLSPTDEMSVDTKKLVYSGLVRDLPTTADLSSPITCTMRNNNMLTVGVRQFPSHLGYSETSDDFLKLTGSTDPQRWLNLEFSMPLNFYRVVDETLRFTFNTVGTYFRLYTVQDLSDSATGNNVRRVYRYEMDNTIPAVDYDQSSGEFNGFKTLNVQFNSRSYFDVPLGTMLTSTPDGGPYDSEINGYVNGLTLDPSWSSPENYTLNIGWGFRNDTIATRFVTEVLMVPSGQQKFIFMTKENFLTMKNQLGFTVAFLNWDGALVVPSTNLRVLNIAPAIQSVATSTTSVDTMGQHSVASLINYERQQPA